MDSIAEGIVAGDEAAGTNDLVGEVGVGWNLALGLGVEPAEDLAGGLLIPTRGALVGEIDGVIFSQGGIEHHHG